jgi:hypothetical protein
VRGGFKARRGGPERGGGGAGVGEDDIGEARARVAARVAQLAVVEGARGQSMPERLCRQRRRALAHRALPEPQERVQRTLHDE